MLGVIAFKEKDYVKSEEIIAKAIKSIDKNIIFLVPTGSQMEIAAKKLNMKIACEIFADRNYEDNGNLVSRKKSHALITNPAKAANQAMMIIKRGEFISLDGNSVSINAQTICIHSDTPNALAIAKAVKIRSAEI